MANISPASQICALLQVQFRSFVKTLRGQGRRLRVSVSILFSVFWYGLWMAAAALLIGLFGGLAWAGSPYGRSGSSNT